MRRKLTREDLLPYVARDWHRLDEATLAWWRETMADRGAAGILAASDSLRAQAMIACPGWPTEADRAEDLAHHVRLRALLARLPG